MIRHAAAALRSDPSNREWLGLLDPALERSPDVAAVFRGHEADALDLIAALRARVLAGRGQVAQALEQLVDAVTARPDEPFLVWAAEWLARPGTAGSLRIDWLEKGWVPRLLSVINDVPVPMLAEDPRSRTVKAAAHVLEGLSESHPGSALLLVARSFTMRRLGRTEDAGGLAYTAYQRHPDWNAAMAVGLAHRDAGRIEDAANWLRHAISFDPQDVSARLELGDTFLEAKRWDEAIAAYDEVLQQQPDHGWARPSLAFASYQREPSPEDKGALFLMAQRSARAWDLFTRIEPDQPFLNHLPQAREPIVEQLRDAMDHIGNGPQPPPNRRVDLQLPYPDAPSAIVAFRLWAKARELELDVTPTVEHVPTPDPRYHKAPVDFVLWTWDGTQPKATTGAADATISAAIGRIARLPYHLEIWDPMARELGARLGTPALHSLLAVMVDPPPLPAADRDPFDWVRRVQVACALVIGYLEPDWEPSHRKRALYGLLVGPVDWTVDAAVVALAWLGREEPAVHRDATQLFGWMAQQIPADAPPGYEYTLVCCTLWMGGADAETTARLEAQRKDIETRRRR